MGSGYGNGNGSVDKMLFHGVSEAVFLRRMEAFLMNVNRKYFDANCWLAGSAEISTISD